MPKSAPAPYPTPPARAPRWLLWLLPSLRGVENNPLFIRLTGQGFCRRSRRLPFLPAEFKPREGAWIPFSGADPVVMALGAFFSLMAAAIFYPSNLTGMPNPAPADMFLMFLALACPMGTAAAVPLFALRFLGIGRNSDEWQFLTNVSRESWGEGLCLSLLTPAEIENAVFAAAVLRIPGAVAFRTCALTCLFLVFALVANFNYAFTQLFELRAFALAAGLLLLCEMLLLSLLRLAISANRANVEPRKDGADSISSSLEAVLFFGFLHAAGLLALGFVAVLRLRLAPEGGFEVSLFWLAALLCACAWALGLPLARAYFRDSSGKFGRIVCERVRFVSGAAGSSR